MNDEVYLKLDKNCEKVGKNLSKPVLHSTVRHKKQIDHLKHATNSPKKSAGDINTLKVVSIYNDFFFWIMYFLFVFEYTYICM